MTAVQAFFVVCFAFTLGALGALAVTAIELQAFFVFGLAFTLGALGALAVTAVSLAALYGLLRYLLRQRG
jgi:hypothetical protein